MQMVNSTIVDWVGPMGSQDPADRRDHQPTPRRGCAATDGHGGAHSGTGSACSGKGHPVLPVLGAVLRQAPGRVGYGYAARPLPAPVDPCIEADVPREGLAPVLCPVRHSPRLREIPQTPVVALSDRLGHSPRLVHLDQSFEGPR
ncbi:hypothetical protein GCM10010313_20520 [Streptomyces violarus]|nr:hypothetical protein GCM10010313_20520 [Streptomyces violarus]